LPIILRYSKKNFPNVLKVVKEIQAIREKHGASTGQATLVWLLAQDQDIILILGTCNVKVCETKREETVSRQLQIKSNDVHVQYLNENLGSLNVKLSPAASPTPPPTNFSPGHLNIQQPA
jgi:aryl-alcohol dehydrogenase-like predicted oxidoreductase